LLRRQFGFGEPGLAHQRRTDGGANPAGHPGVVTGHAAYGYKTASGFATRRVAHRDLTGVVIIRFTSGDCWSQWFSCQRPERRAVGNATKRQSVAGTHGLPALKKGRHKGEPSSLSTKADWSTRPTRARTWPRAGKPRCCTRPSTGKAFDHRRLGTCGSYFQIHRAAIKSLQVVEFLTTSSDICAGKSWSSGWRTIHRSALVQNYVASTKVVSW